MLKQNESVSLSMNYGEYITEVKCEGKLLVRKLACICGTLLVFLLGSWAIMGGIINAPTLELLVLGFCGIGFFALSGCYKIEYEYIVASAQIEFDAVYRQHRRKELFTLSLDKVKRIAPVNAETEKFIASRTSAKQYDFCSSKKSPRRYFLCYRDGVDEKIVFFDAVSKTLDVLKFYRSSILEIDKEIYDM